MAPRWFSKDRHSYFDGGGANNSSSSPAVLVFLERLLLRLGNLVVVRGNRVNIDISCIIFDILCLRLVNYS